MGVGLEHADAFACLGAYPGQIRRRRFVEVAAGKVVFSWLHIRALFLRKLRYVAGASGTAADGP